MATTDSAAEEMARWRIAYDTISALVARLNGTGNSFGPASTSTSATNNANSVQCCSEAAASAINSASETDPSLPTAPDRQFDVTVTRPADEASRSDGNRDINSRRDSHRVTTVTHSSSDTSDISSVWQQRSSDVMFAVPHPVGTTANPTEPISHEGSDVVDRASSLSLQQHHLNGSGRNTVRNSHVPLFTGPSSVRTELAHPITAQRTRMEAEARTTTSSTIDSRFPFESATMVELFRRLNDTFYAETFLWIYLNSLRHPAARRLRYRLGLLGMATGRSTEQATANVLSGYLTGYRQSRQTLTEQVETVLRGMSSMTSGDLDPEGGTRRAAWLGQLSVELGVALNPRQMMKSFAAVVRDLVARTPAAAAEGLAPNGSWMGRPGHQHSQNRQRQHHDNDVSERRNTESASIIADIDALIFDRDITAHPLQSCLFQRLNDSSTGGRDLSPHQQQQQRTQQQQPTPAAVASRLTVQIPPSIPISLDHSTNGFGLAAGHPADRQWMHQRTGRGHSFSAPSSPAVSADATMTSHSRRRRHIQHHHQHHSSSSTAVGAGLPPPPPPYPSFLLHFLSLLASPPGHQPTVPTGLQGGEFSYEELLALDDQIGLTKFAGLSVDVIQQLPVYNFGSDRDEHCVRPAEQHKVENRPICIPPSTASQRCTKCDSLCVICLDRFTCGQQLRVLPCRHEYHVNCVDRWLMINRTCPVCRYEIKPEIVVNTSSK